MEWDVRMCSERPCRETKNGRCIAFLEYAAGCHFRSIKFAWQVSFISTCKYASLFHFVNLPLTLSPTPAMGTNLFYISNYPRRLPCYQGEQVVIYEVDACWWIQGLVNFIGKSCKTIMTSDFLLNVHGNGLSDVVASEITWCNLHVLLDEIFSGAEDTDACFWSNRKTVYNC